MKTALFIALCLATQGFAEEPSIRKKAGQKIADSVKKYLVPFIIEGTPLEKHSKPKKNSGSEGFAKKNGKPVDITR